MDLEDPKPTFSAILLAAVSCAPSVFDRFLLTASHRCVSPPPVPVQCPWHPLLPDAVLPRKGVPGPLPARPEPTGAGGGVPGYDTRPLSDPQRGH